MNIYFTPKPSRHPELARLNDFIGQVQGLLQINWDAETPDASGQGDEVFRYLARRKPDLQKI